MSTFQLTTEQVAEYDRDGYIIVRNFLSPEEAGKLHSIAVGDDTMKKHSFDLNDQAGKKQNWLCGTARAMILTACSQKVIACLILRTL